MDRTQQDSPQARITVALAMARKYRHHPDCYCRKYQHTACTAAAALWENALNRELEKTREAHHV